MLKNIQGLKEENNYIISSAIKEILTIGLRVENKSLGGIEDDISLMMKALQKKNKVYDFAVMITYNDLLQRYEGKVAYSLINSEESQYQEMIEFNF